MKYNNNGGLRKFERKHSTPFSLLTQNNSELKKVLNDLEKGRNELVDTTNKIREALEVINDKEEDLSRKENEYNFFAKIVSKVVPSKYLSGKFWEREEALEDLEKKLRVCLDRIQGSIAAIAKFGIEKRESQDILRETIDEAIEEKWDPEHLQKIITELAGFEIYPEIEELLSLESGVLSPAVKEERRDALLNDLKASYEIGERLMDLFAKAGNSGLIIFQKALSEFYQFNQLFRPIILLKRSVQDMSKMDQLMFIARDALFETLEKSMRLLALTIDAIRLLPENSIISIKTDELLKRNIQHVEEKLNMLLEKEKKTKFFAKPLTPEALPVTGMIG